jgi:hypothetical protein
MELIQQRRFPYGGGEKIVSEYVDADRGTVHVEVRIEQPSARNAWERSIVIYRATGEQSVMSAAAQGAVDAIIDSSINLFHNDRVAWDFSAHDAPENAAYRAAYQAVGISF